MRTKQIYLDLAVGGALAFLLLSIFVIDRLLTPATAQNQGGTQVAQGGSTLLGNPHIDGQIKALGDIQRLEKLKVVRLTAKVRFATSKNVNDITLMWCWEPKIVIRFEEENPQAVGQIAAMLTSGGPAARQQLLQMFKAKMDFSSNANLERQLDNGFETVLAANNYQPLVHTVVLLESKQAFQIFNKSLAIPLKPEASTSMRNLCFALSISNLIPISKHNFKIEPGEAQLVRNKKCDQFTVYDLEGLKLQFLFDQETKLLAKITHMGHDPRPFAAPNSQILWEHYFSDYRETEGIKQWHHEEVNLQGQPFATLDVTNVKFFDDLQPELQRPNQ